MSSIVSYVGVSETGHCGYCKLSKRAKAKIEQTEEKAQNQNSPDDEEEDEQGDSVVFGLLVHCLSLNTFNQLLDLGLWAHRLTVYAYQNLVDRGWRRSGRYLYKPLMERTCCPQYTIRLDIHKFRLSRTQKRVLRTMHNFLKYDRRPEEKAIVKEEDVDGCRRKFKPKRPIPMEDNYTEFAGIANNEREKDKATQNGIPKGQKKKEIRRRKAEERLKGHGIDLEEYKKERAAREEARRRTLRSYLDKYSDPIKLVADQWKHKLMVRTIGQPSPELEADLDEEFELFKKYQIQIHKDKEGELSLNSFTRFLSASPLISEKQPAGGRRKKYSLGSYHQQYRLDGRLIAVGVVDILPRCLSAKYFFYDPDFAFLSLGTYSALCEIDFTQQLAIERPELHFYYMGFYLFDCPKMRYKGRFRPSDLLCDRCYQWAPLAQCEPILEGNEGTFSTFHPESEPERWEPTDEEISQILCIFSQHHLVKFGQIRLALQQGKGLQANNGQRAEQEDEDKPSLEEVEEKVRNFVRYTGHQASTDIVLAM